MGTLKEYCNCQIIGKVTDDEKITVKAFEGSEIEYWLIVKRGGINEDNER